MLDTPIIRQEMSSEMKLLLEQYPREAWSSHPGFKEKTQHWLGAHRMFRTVASQILTDTESYIDQSMETSDYADRLSYYGNGLVRNLHGHHHWEDHSYFPELFEADPRFQAGLDVLEQDHDDLEQFLDDFTTTGNRLIKLTHLDEKQAKETAFALRDTSETICSFLTRHLTDEEELAVPIILHHRLRG